MSTYVTGDTRGAFGGILSYRHWFCGHYHIEMIIDKLQFLCEDYTDFPEEV